jgi:hypothetical protein
MCVAKWSDRPNGSTVRGHKFVCSTSGGHPNSKKSDSGIRA